MTTRAHLALAILLGIGAGSAAAAEYGELGTGSTSAQSGTAPGSASSPSLPTQGGPTGNETAAGSAGVSGDFRLLDANGDGFVSRSEAASGTQGGTGFDQADADRDGRLSPAEWQAWQSAGGSSGR